MKKHSIRKTNLHPTGRSGQGFSLVETAFTIIIVFVATTLMLKLLGGTKVESQVGGNTHGTISQLTGHKNSEFQVARAIVEDVISGNNGPISSGSCAVTLPAGDGTASSGNTCSDNRHAKPIYYGWSVRRIVNGTANFNGNYTVIENNALTRLDDSVSTSAAGVATGNPQLRIPNGNQYYVASLNIYRDPGAINGNNPQLFSLPFSFFRNVNPPVQIQSRISSVITIDSSDSMNDVGTSATTRFQIAQNAFNEFLDLVSQDTYVSNDSAFSFATFNTGARFELPDAASGVFETFSNKNSGFTSLKRRISCMEPVDEVVDPISNPFPCTGGQTRILPTGQTNLALGLHLDGLGFSRGANQKTVAEQSILNHANGISPTDRDRIYIWITDGLNPTATDRTTVNGTPQTTFLNSHFNRVKSIPRSERVTYFIIGAGGNPAEPPRSDLLRSLAHATPGGLYFPINNLDNLRDGMQQIETQFQFFALRRKLNRWSVPL